MANQSETSTGLCRSSRLNSLCEEGIALGGSAHTVIEETKLDEDDDEIYLSVVWNGGKLGAAYYDLNTAEVHMLKDITETDNFNILRKVWQQARPKHVITSTKADERFLNALSDFGKIESPLGLHADVNYMPSVEFCSTRGL